jgi:glyoxylase-like metal-dependent hydrolase (beta-lactamase superfamily II)
MKITSEVFQVGGDGFTSSLDGSVYLINTCGHSVLVDAGCGKSVDKILRNVQNHGTALSQIEYLMITHCHYDHTGGIQDIRERTKCKVITHELDARFLEEGNESVTGAGWYGGSLPRLMIDIKLTGKRETVDLGGRKIEAIHVPGHSPGSLVYLMESEGLKILFGQDLHGPFHDGLRSSRGKYVKSLNLMISLQADILCEGHYGIFRGKEKVEAFITSFM